jgi:hypothetical protein
LIPHSHSLARPLCDSPRPSQLHISLFLVHFGHLLPVCESSTSPLFIFTSSFRLVLQPYVLGAFLATASRMIYLLWSSLLPLPFLPSKHHTLIWLPDSCSSPSFTYLHPLLLSSPTFTFYFLHPPSPTPFHLNLSSPSYSHVNQQQVPQVEIRVQHASLTCHRRLAGYCAGLANRRARSGSCHCDPHQQRLRLGHYHSRSRYPDQHQGLVAMAPQAGCHS